MVLQNTGLLSNKENKIFEFDLKGSIVNRFVDTTDLKTLMKDVNFLRLNEKKNITKIRRQKSIEIMNTIRADCQFLERHNLLDYSLLLKVEKVDRKTTNLKATRNKIISWDKKYVYHIGIIDYLQRWNFTKQSESCFKRNFKYRSNKNLVSAINPKIYNQRFQEFMG